MLVDIGNDDYIILCNFGGRVVSGFEVIEGVGAGWSSGSKKKAGLTRVKCPQEDVFSSAIHNRHILKVLLFSSLSSSNEQ